MNTKKMIFELEERLRSYVLEVSTPIIEHKNLIVGVGAFTVSTDENRVVILSNKYFPDQFSESEVRTISSMSFTNYKDDTISPKVYLRNEWYGEKIEMIQVVLAELKKITG